MVKVLNPLHSIVDLSVVFGFFLQERGKVLPRQLLSYAYRIENALGRSEDFVDFLERASCSLWICG